MGRSDDGPAAVEFLDTDPGETDGSAAPGRRVPRWIVWVAVAAVGAGIVVAVLGQGVASHRTNRAAPASAPRTTRHVVPAPRIPAATPAATPAAPPAARTVHRFGHPLLPGAAGWQLLARSDASVARVDPGRGVVVTTPMPRLSSTGPVSFLAVPGAALVRPVDLVPAFVIPDNGPARQMPARLATEGPMFPGPDARHVWVPATGNGHTLVLKGIDGTPTGTRIRSVPASTSPLEAVPDGRGYLIYPAARGVVDVRPDGLHRITNGALVAIGPNGWLVRECGRPRRCSLVSIDLTGRRHSLGPTALRGAPYGAISPTGRKAALYTVGGGGHLSLRLLELPSRTSRHVPVSVSQSPDGTVAWSPDGRWLLVVGADGHVWAVDARTGHATPLPGVSGVAQLAVSPIGSR